MKVNRISTMARLTGISIALALLTGISGQLNAQNGAKGGATKLLELSGRSITPKVETSNYKPMACATCTDKVIQVRDTDSKGGARGLVAGVPLTKAVARHGCNACSVDWTVKGHGRAKVSVATHKCPSCGA